MQHSKSGTKPAATRHQSKIFGPDRQKQFLKFLRRTGVVKHAARETGISTSFLYKHRKRDPEFAALWDAATGSDGKLVPRLINPGGHGKRVAMVKQSPNEFTAEKQERFFRRLTETSNITLSAQYAGVHPNTVYRHRRDDPHFAKSYQDAVDAGFEELAMTLLQWARFGVPKPVMHGGEVKDTVLTPDPALGLKLLARNDALQARRISETGCSDAIKQRIEARVADMRDRLIEARPDLMQNCFDPAG